MSEELTADGFPGNDGWSWVYRFYATFVKPRKWLRRMVRAYLDPSKPERAGMGKMYRLFGVHLFGKIIPTGGIVIRRLTRARMAPYTLARTSLSSAREFRYRTCIFELLHLPFLLALLALSGYRLLMGRVDLALENLLVNLVFNIYPVMHHRYTRLRIDRLVRISQVQCPPVQNEKATCSVGEEG